MKTHAIKLFKRLATLVLCSPVLALASAGIHLDKATVSTEPQVLQRGAELFIKQCLNCHGASAVRYSDLKKIGFSEEKITGDLLYTGEKIGDLMTVAMTRQDAEAWFGTAPPDLSLIARAKASEAGSGADYLYTYLRGFYQDESRPTGWNNKVFANVGMPHVLWQLQGTQVEEVADEHGHKTTKLTLGVPGEMSPQDYDNAVNDLVSFMVWMAEPVADTRKTIGYFVLAFLLGFYVLTHALGKTYWKNIH